MSTNSRGRIGRRNLHIDRLGPRLPSSLGQRGSAPRRAAALIEAEARAMQAGVRAPRCAQTATTTRAGTLSPDRASMSSQLRDLPTLGQASFEHARAIQNICALVRERTGTDFFAYRRPTVERRIQNRMISLGIESFDQYLARLQADLEETLRLVERLTIKVSRFYRNQFTFDTLRSEVLPALAAEAGSRPLSVWSAGCAFGEEAYTLVMLLDELGRDDIVEATDLDPSALAGGQAALYSEEAIRELPADLKERYLTPVTSPRGAAAYRVDDRLRSRVRFTQNDLTNFEHDVFKERTFDLILCRNVLIYLQHDLQERTFINLLKRIRPGGYLCLGEAEWPPSSANLWLTTSSRKTRVFRVRKAIQGDVA